ncbi:MAG: PKD domain-containing protein [Thermoplasmata archaeon]
MASTDAEGQPGEISLGDPIITSFSADDSTPLAGQVVTFTCTAEDPDNDPLNFTFEFGDGTFGYVELPEPGTATITHVYQVASMYEAYVYVRDVWSGYTSAGPLELTVSWATFSLALKPGWNLVSVPLLNYGYKASTLGLSTGDMIARWDSATQRYDKTHVVNVTPPALTDFDIMPGTGYWVYVAKDTSLLLKGAIPTGRQSHDITVPSGGGWAIVGFNTLSSAYHASDVPSMYTNGGISTVVAYRNGKYVQYIKGMPVTDFSILPGEGYWVYCQWSGTLSYLSDPGYIPLAR